MTCLQKKRRNEQSRSLRKIVVGNEVFVASGKRLSNRRFSYEREKNTIVLDGFHNELTFCSICYASHFSVPLTLPTIFRVLCDARDMLMPSSCKNAEERRQRTPTSISSICSTVLPMTIFSMWVIVNCLAAFYACRPINMFYH